ncbi:MAG TPA: glycosyltransferase [Candidatus Polarisedimenticolaceae bacterium]
MNHENRRVAYVLRTYPELSETFVVREVEGLVAARVPVTVLSAFPAQHPASGVLDGEVLAHRGSVPSTRVPNAGAWARALASDLLSLGLRPRKWARALRLGFYARRAAALLPGDTARLHAHFANDAAALCRYTAALTGLPYRVTAHAYDLYQDPFLLGPNLAAAERVYTVSTANEAWLLLRARRLGIEAGRVRVLRCGLDLAQFAFRAATVPSRPARLLCVARLVPKKGHAVLLEALERLAGTAGEAGVDFVGEGPLLDDLRRAADRPALRGRVGFVGALPPTEVLARMRAADAVVLASIVAKDGDRDGLPVVLVEAAALGVPLIATPVSGIPELVDGSTGWLARAADADGVAEAIAAFAAAPHEERLRRSRAARARVEREFDLAKQVAELSS